jgi:two-component system, cell cycle response regulator CpdR
MARILIAEDQDATREAYALALRAAGHTVVTASDGAEALDRLSADGAIDLLLTDVDMPAMTGVELARAALAKRPTLPVILMSAHGDSGFRGADQLGAAIRARLTKPVSNKDIVATVTQALGR